MSKSSAKHVGGRGKKVTKRVCFGQCQTELPELNDDGERNFSANQWKEDATDEHCKRRCVKCVAAGVTACKKQTEVRTPPPLLAYTTPHRAH